MRAARLLGELEALAEKLGVEVVYERLPSCRSGLCRVNNQYLLFVDRALPEDKRANVPALLISGSHVFYDLVT